jgi:hypothetical protein
MQTSRNGVTGRILCWPQALGRGNQNDAIMIKDVSNQPMRLASPVESYPATVAGAKGFAAPQ